jgi:disulfide bond formation protein DsbB
MANLIATALPYIVLFSHLLLAVLIVAFISRDSWGKKIVFLIGKYALFLGLLLSLMAMTGSLFYSEVVGYEPCVLCWWQRILIYPQVILFLTALKFKHRGVFKYAWRLSILNVILAGYHSFVYLGGKSVLPCTALGGACSKVYVMEFGYITIPLMSLTIALYILLVTWANKLYAKDSYSQ